MFSIASGAARALWLAQLSKSLDEAHEMTCHLSEGSMDVELMELYIAIEAARHEIRELQLGREPWPVRRGDYPGLSTLETGPERIQISPWRLQSDAA